MQIFSKRLHRENDSVRHHGDAVGRCPRLLKIVAQQRPGSDCKYHSLYQSYRFSNNKEIAFCNNGQERDRESATMTVHSIHIFDRRGKTVFTKRYMSKQPHEKKEDDEEELEEQRKLIFGMLYSLREVSTSLSPATNKDKPGNKSGDADDSNNKIPADLQLVKTGGSTLYNYETVSGLRFALYTTAETSYGVSTVLGSAGPSGDPNTPGGGAGGGGPPVSGPGPNVVVVGGVAGSGSGSSSGTSSHGMSGGVTNSTVTNNIRSALQHIYETIWVNCVIRSPMYRGPTGTDISSTNFEATLDSYLKGMSWFR